VRVPLPVVVHAAACSSMADVVEGAGRFHPVRTLIRPVHGLATAGVRIRSKLGSNRSRSRVGTRSSHVGSASDPGIPRHGPRACDAGHSSGPCAGAPRRSRGPLRRPIVRSMKPRSSRSLSPEAAWSCRTSPRRGSGADSGVGAVRATRVRRSRSGAPARCGSQTPGRCRSAGANTDGAHALASWCTTRVRVRPTGGATGISPARQLDGCR
jgi:hypothetical protein